MLQLMRQYPSWSFLIITTGTIAASEVIWFAYKSICKWMRWREAQVHEVLMFNELGFECMLEHRMGIEEGRMYHCQNKYCAQRNIHRIIEQLDKAKYSIDLAMYSMQSIEMTRALKNALLRKVVVRIIVSLQRTSKINRHLLDLIERGAHLRKQNSNYFMHHKFCVIDGEERVNHLWSLKKRNYGPETTYSVLINGSLNWTDGGIGINWENVVI
ncbi:mitochondrial cardiolipin hydrolase-like, partial [Drosophila navojoa]|uniref:mitochondrial cardiolipin hydrolase-like n=1 Tax=Drosophila navojoa TaxID=7232 RepID=UPI0011BF6CF8